MGEPLLLMGNVRAGKTTIAELLRLKLDSAAFSRDDLIKNGVVKDEKILLGYIYMNTDEY